MIKVVSFFVANFDLKTYFIAWYSESIAFVDTARSAAASGHICQINHNNRYNFKEEIGFDLFIEHNYVLELALKNENITIQQTKTI